MPAAIRSLLARVRCTSSALVSRASCSSASSGDSSTAATRGSRRVGGICSLATSSDCTISRAGPSSGSTS